MNCVPLIYWKETTQVRTLFEDFTLVGEKQILNELTYNLDHIKIKDDSKNQLVLRLSEEVKVNEEEYKLKIEENQVVIESPSVQGLFQGLSTLKLLLFFWRRGFAPWIRGRCSKVSSPRNIFGCI